MDTSRYIQSCNPARFVVTSSILIFSILFALQLDGFIQINYWLLFLPLFIWKMLVIFGASTGVFFWCKNGERGRFCRRPDNDCRSLIIYLFLHLLIFTFELLSCDKLVNQQHEPKTRWTLCFIPMFLCTILAFISCLWSLKVQRNFLIQAFIAANGFFFLFFPLRLDEFISWRYVIVFIPVWISLCIALLFVFSKLILSIIHRCSRRVLANQRKTSTVTEAVLYTLMFVPLTIFAVLLADRLDQGDNGKVSFTVISIPLWISLLAWLTFSFGATDANPWWFGLRRDLCEILLGQCPAMTLFFNNQFKMGPRPSTTVPTNEIIVVDPKGTEIIHLNQRLTTSTDKDLPAKYNFLSLLEPD